MRAVVQKVSRASVAVAGETLGSIDIGLLVFLGIAPDDTEEDLKYLVKKVTQLRIFEDAQDYDKFWLILKDKQKLFGFSRKVRSNSAKTFSISTTIIFIG